MTGSQSGDGPQVRPAGPHTQRHAAVVLAATKALVEVHEGTLRGLREVEALLNGATPRAITDAVARETRALKEARALVVELQELVDRGARLTAGPRVSDRPTVADLRTTSVARSSTSHLTAIRQWDISERHRLRRVTAAPAAHLAELLRGEGRELVAASVERVWCEGVTAGPGA